MTCQVSVLLRLLVLLGTVGCASPQRSFDQRAQELGFVREDIDGLGYRHSLYLHPLPVKSGNRLHVYLSGDGTPWLRGGVPATDPTPRKPVALELMALDTNPSVLLGRPCYHGLTSEPGCRADLWTDGRYSEAVVRSLAAALGRLGRPEGKMVLIGYSGGGALTMLLAPRLPAVVAVVTLAANLDIDAWSDHHGYRRLTGSLNPVDQPPLSPSVVQLHYVGSRDRRAPAALASRVASRNGEPEPIVLKGPDHASGWHRHWPAILRKLDDLLGERPDGQPSAQI